jgi:hypothetical protein
MKKLNDLINNLETYKELTTVPRDTLIKELKECKDELTEQLRLHSVSQQRELLAFIEEVSEFDALVSSTRLRLRAKELLKANCG